ncbi:MAG: hypothetical protein WAO02_16010 [Verrucomicrobiia bacterium]
MKSKHVPKLSQKMRQKDPFEIRSVGISPEDEITALFRSVISASVAPNKTQVATAAVVPSDYLKTLISIATNTWRAKTKMVDPSTGEIREDLKRVGRHIEAIYRNLAEVGIVIRDHTGDAYDEGQPMKVVASKPTPGQDKKRVSETLLPSIFWNNRLVQNGEIEITTPLTSQTSA